MTAPEIIENLNVGETLKAFGVNPATVSGLEGEGILPLRPRGRITAQWLKKLERWLMANRGIVPEEGRKILQAYLGEGGQDEHP